MINSKCYFIRLLIIIPQNKIIQNLHSWMFNLYHVKIRFETLSYGHLFFKNSQYFYMQINIKLNIEINNLYHIFNK